MPVTFALRPTLGLRLTYAETFASEIRLSLIRRGDETRKLPSLQARVHAAADARAHAGAGSAMKARLALGLTDSDRAAQVIALAEEAGEIEVVATPQTSDDVITVLAHTEVEVLVLDEELGPLPVLELARQLQAKHPAVGLLLLAAHEASPDLLRQARARRLPRRALGADDRRGARRRHRARRDVGAGGARALRGRRPRARGRAHRRQR